MSKKCFTIFFFFFLVFKFKNRGEKDTFEAHGKSSKAEPLGNSSCERKVQGPSACHQCPLKALGGAGGRWHPGAVYFMVSLKMSERGPWGPHFITQPSAALQSAGFWPPGGGRPVNNCGCSPGEEHWLLDTSLDEVYWPCSHSRAIPSFPSQLEWKIGLPWANTRGILNSPS